MDSRLHELRARRRGLLAESIPLAAVTLALGFLDLPGLAWPAGTEAGLALGLLALVLALTVAGSGRFCRRFVELLAAPCPRCDGLFFVSWHRLLTSLPYPASRCAHCDLSLRRGPPRPEDRLA